MARIIAALLTAMAVLLVILCAREYRERKQAERGRAVYLSQAMLWVGGICGLFFLAICWLVTMQDESVGVSLCFGAFALLAQGMMLAWKNVYILYDHNGFTVRNLFGRQKSYSYRELTAYRFSRGVSGMKLYVGKKIIGMDEMSVDAIDFLQEARKGYARCSGKTLPNRWAEARTRDKKDDRGDFAAHVHNPGEFLAAFILVMAFLVGVGALLIIDTWKAVVPEDCEKLEVSFSQWKIQEDELFLRADGHAEAFRIGNYENYLHGLQQLQEACDGQTDFAVWVQRVTPDEEPDYYRVQQLSAGGVVYRSFADSTADQREDLPVVSCVFGGVILFMLAMSWLTYCIGCNPRKYPKWLVYAFFKKNAISF